MMQQLINYLLQAAFSLAILHGAYQLLLRGETFHQTNRWILSGSLLLSALLPLISIPAFGQQAAGIMNGLSSFLLPVVVSPEGSPAAAAGSQGSQTLSFWQVAGSVYIFVCAALLFRLLFQLAGILRLVAGCDKVRKKGYSLILSQKLRTPFSFFRYIFLNPEASGANRYQEILDHELVHARELHSIDNLLSELYAVIFWFSPVSWWHKREILLNLEYLADRGVLRKGCEPGKYQLQLLRASLSEARYALANHFAQSIIKRRIKMINTDQSPSKRAWKYLLLVPAAAAALFLLNCTGDLAPAESTELKVEYDQEVILSAATDTNGHNKEVYDFAEVEKKPIFPGGNDKIVEYVSKNFRYPAEAREAGIQGTVYVQFTIRKDGSIDSVKVVRGGKLGGGLAEEALRVVKSMPAWTPGEHKGEKVAVSYTLPIFARLAEEKVPATGTNLSRTWSLTIPFTDVDKKPQFPGGNDKILSYVSAHFKYPAEARKANIQGTVYVQFTISPNGEVRDAMVVRGEELGGKLGGGLAEEALRVVKSMPAWTPGEHKGEKVAVSYTIPIFARLAD